LVAGLTFDSCPQIKVLTNWTRITSRHGELDHGSSGTASLTTLGPRSPASSTSDDGRGARAWTRTSGNASDPDLEPTPAADANAAKAGRPRSSRSRPRGPTAPGASMRVVARTPTGRQIAPDHRASSRSPEPAVRAIRTSRASMPIPSVVRIDVVPSCRCSRICLPCCLSLIPDARNWVGEALAYCLAAAEPESHPRRRNGRGCDSPAVLARQRPSPRRATSSTPTDGLVGLGAKRRAAVGSPWC
jgi:hypothetical protein